MGATAELLKRAEQAATAYEAEHGIADESSNDSDVEQPATEQATEEVEEKTEDDEKADAPSVAERVKFRAHKRKQIAALEARKQALETEMAQMRATLEQRYSPFSAAAQALADGDVDAFAKATAKAAGIEAENWSDLNRYVLRKFADPAYKDVMTLKEKLRQKEEAERKQQEAIQREAATRQQAEARTRYYARLGEELKALGGPAAALAEDPAFVHAVFQQQMNRYDPSTQTTCTAKEAAAAVVEVARQKYALQQKAFAQATPESQLPEAPVGKSAKRRTKTMSTARSVEASKAAKPSNHEEWKRRWARAMAESEDDEP